MQSTNLASGLRDLSFALPSGRGLRINVSNGYPSTMKRGRDTYYGVAQSLIICFVLFMLSASLQLLLGNIPLSRILGAIIAFILMFHLLIERLTNNRILAICLLGIAAMHGVAVSTEITEEFEFWIYLAVALMLLNFVSSDRGVEAIMTAIYKLRGMIRLATLATAIFTAILLISGLGYSDSWGNERFFRGLCSNEHTMASVCCLAIVFVTLVDGSKKGWRPETLLEYIVFSFALFQTGARAFLVPVVVLWLLIIHRSVSQKWLKIVIVLLCLFAAFFLFSFGGMALKFDSLDAFSNGQSALSLFTSGRSDFWVEDMVYYLSSSPLGILLGNSASSVYDINQSFFGTRIWAHNDVIMIICSAGIVSIAIYLSTIFIFFKYYYLNTNRVMTILMLIYVLFPALINGFFQYQHFVYSAVLLACATLRFDDRFEEKSGGTDCA